MSNQQDNDQVARFLNSMGSSWFILYKYDEIKFHDKLSACATFKMRKSVYENHKDLHQQFIERILRKDPRRLGMNGMGIQGEEIIRMAMELRDKQMQK